MTARSLRRPSTKISHPASRIPLRPLRRRQSDEYAFADRDVSFRGLDWNSFRAWDSYIPRNATFLFHPPLHDDSLRHRAD